jgi:SAM-dependent methyltransferase
VATEPDFDDWRRAPNIAGDPETYELENQALLRDGSLDLALWRLAPWGDRRLLDIGCGTGFWLPRYAERARSVVGIEPDPHLCELAERRCRAIPGVEVRPGSAEHLPLADASVDIAHARFAYFFGDGAEAGPAEVARVLASDGVLLAVDNSWSGGDFAALLRSASDGNAAIDPARTDAWWAERGAIRHEIEGGWSARSESELERILRIEFASDVVDRFLVGHEGASLSYQFATFEWRPSA